MKRVTDIAPADLATAVDRTVILVDTVREKLSAAAGWQRLEQGFYDALTSGTLPTASVIAWAEAGHPSADAALRRFAAEHIDQGRESELLAQVRAYVVKTLVKPLLPRHRGRDVAETLMRDIGICVMVELAANGTGLPPTRTASTTAPSAAFIVHRALRKRGIPLSERRVNNIYWARARIAPKLASSLDKLAEIPSPT